MFNDPGDNIGPKSCDLWKPVIAAVNGMACGGAFYMLGEVEFIIAAEHATFFDPHVTYGMTAAFEPIHMAGIMPFPEIMRLSLLGNHERMSAQRALRDRHGQRGRARRPSSHDARHVGSPAIIASQPQLAIEGTVRAHLVDARDAATRGGAARLRVRRDGHEPGVDRRGPEVLRVRQARGVETAVMAGTKRVAIVGAALSDIGRVDTKTPFELHYQAASRAIADAGLTKADIDGFGSSGMGLLAPIEICEYLGLRPTWIDGTGVGGATWEFMVEHATAAILAGHAEVVVLVYGSTIASWRPARTVSVEVRLRWRNCCRGRSCRRRCSRSTTSSRSALSGPFGEPGSKCPAMSRSSVSTITRWPRCLT